MKLLLINAVCGIRSTGRICKDIAREYDSKGYEVKIAYGREGIPSDCQKYAIRIGTDLDVYFHAVMSKFFDKRGYYSKRATKEFLKWADQFDPDELWLHNLHDYYINIELLFSWIKTRPNMIVKWTQHDCWAFTGGCMHFSHFGCDGWKSDCSECKNRPSRSLLPLIHNQKKAFSDKKKWFSDVRNMELITPSRWMADLVERSFLKEYPVKVIHNRIDTTVFKPTNGCFKEKHGLVNKKIVLGVASAWGKSKGLLDFYKVSQELTNEYCVVLVGLSKKQLKRLPSNIIGIERTNNTEELADIYSSADVFLNLTYVDTYPTVNLEARACGTRIITYNAGGSPESAGKEAVVVPTGDVRGVLEAIYCIT